MSFHPETAYTGGGETEPYGPSPKKSNTGKARKPPKHGG
ncbi:phage associated protein [Neisseria gonorrhoeae]|nr:phage associated protein [Neisseria gonorrhoeae]QBK52667.1 phage associated protein [Neisseria gonorrhoeae]